MESHNCRSSAIGVLAAFLFFVISLPAWSEESITDLTGKMYWTDTGTDKIQRANLDGSNIEDLVNTELNSPWGIAVDLPGGKMYWTDSDADRIQRANLDGSNIETLLTGLSGPWGITLDQTSSKMYWVDFITDKILRANLDGSNVEELINTGLVQPYGIALDPIGGKMYWTDCSTNKIQRANLDGSGIEDLVTTGLDAPYYIALDLSAGKMYWTDYSTKRIQRADLNGSNIENLVTGLSGPLGIALNPLDGKIYWIDYTAKKIQKADLDGSNIEDLITTGLSNPSDIEIPQMLDLDDLKVEPPTSFISSGDEGGPFTPAGKTYTITNDGPNSIDWSASAAMTWLDVVPSGGTLVAGGSNTVEVSINANADTLSSGEYTDIVIFSNLTSGYDQNREVILQVKVAGWKSVLAYTGYTDMSQEYPNTLAAIDSVSTDYSLFEFNRYAQIDAMLPGHDVLLIPEQKNASSSQLMNIGIAWATTLQTFLDRGGVIIQCDFNGKYGIMTGSGLMSISSSTNCTNTTVTVTDPYNEIAQGVSSTYTALDGSSYYSTTEGTVVVERSGYAVVINKEEGLGNVVLIGHDYYLSNPDQDLIVGNAVFNLPSIRDDLGIAPSEHFISSGDEGGPFTPAGKTYTITNDGPNSIDWTASATAAWLDVTPDGGSLGPGDSDKVEVSINTLANILPNDTYTDTVAFSNLTSGHDQRREVTLRVAGWKSVLAYTGYTDMSQEYPNTLAAIDSVSTDYSLDELDDYTQLDSMLFGHDVLLIPEQEHASASQLVNIGATWATTLQSFIDMGGVVIQCDFAGRYGILTGSGLMSISSASECIGATVTVTAPEDPIAQGVSNTYNALTRSSYYTTAEKTVVVERIGYGPVVINKETGLGNVVLIGHDYYNSNPDQDRIVGNAVFYLPSITDDLRIGPREIFTSSGAEGGPFTPTSMSYTLANYGPNSLDWTSAAIQPWLDVTPGSGTLGPGESVGVTVYLTADVNNLLMGSHNDTVTFTNTTSGLSQPRKVTLEVIPGPAEIEVTDSIPPVNDLNMPFGDVILGLSRTEQVTISNTDPDYSLVITDISLGGGGGGGEIEDFEDGDISDYTYLGGMHNVTGAAAHDGGYGLESSMAGWIYRDDAAVQVAQGDTISYWVYLQTNGRAYCGFGASAIGTYSIVAASNTNELLLQLNVGYDFLDIGSVYQTWTFNKWYRMEVEWGVGGNITGRLYDSDGTTLINTVTANNNTYTYGGIAFRAFDIDCFDTVERWSTLNLSDRELMASRLPSSSDVIVHDSANAIGWDEENQSPIFRKPEVPIYPHNEEHSGEVVLTGLAGLSGGFRLENVPTFPVVIPPLDSITFDVNFAPTEVKDYEETLVIYSSDANNPEVEVQLSGRGILDYLEVIPDANFVFSGHPGGPFVPSNTSYQLTNIGPVTIDWVVDSNIPWLDLSASGGTLSPGESVTVIVAPNANADSLAEGYYYEQLDFLDVTTTLQQRRAVCLNVYTEPKIWVSPYSFDVTIPQGSNDIQILTIGNTGGSGLDFTLSSYQTGFTPPLDQGLTTAVTQVETEEDKIVLEYEFSEPVVVIGTEGEYDSVQIEGLQVYGRTGAPIIPVRPVTVLIPYGKKVVTTRVMSFNTRQLDGTYQLPPAQKPYPLSYQGAVEPTEPDPAIYGQKTPWPGVAYAEVAAQSKRGYQLFVVNLFPLQYVPATGKISYVTKLRLEIDLVDTRALGVLRSSNSVEAQLSAAVDNPTALETYLESVTSLETLGQPVALPPGGPYQYVIITNEALEAVPGSWNFQALRDAKIACGMTATIVTTQWIYTNYDGTKPSGGSDNQTRIRNFLIDAYQSWGTEYVLLGGTNSIVPARMFRVDGENMPVDMYYGCVEPSACTFDYDADGYYGEPTDGVGGGDVDLYAEIYVGRAAVENPTELQNFVMKTLTYDSRSNDEYLPRISMVGEYLGFGGVSEYAKDSMEQIRLGGSYDGYFTYGFKNHVQPDFFDFNTIDCMPSNPSCCWPLYEKEYYWPKSDLIDLMNSGVHVFNHLGHANYTYDMKLSTSDLSLLTNSDYFFAYSQGCDPGGFDVYNCFAEVITTMEHGAFAVIMNARSGWGRYNSTDGPSQRFDREFWDAVLGEGMLEVGRANQDSKEDNLWDINGGYIRWCYYELNLFGDPAQQLQFTKSGDSSGWMGLVSCSGIVAPGGTADVNVIFDSNRPAGTYNGHIVVYSNDPYIPDLIIPVTMNIEPEDHFTELFDPGFPINPNDPNCNDMAYRTLTLRPDGSGYQACINEANDFPVDPNGGTIISLGDDDYAAVNLDGAGIDLFGMSYNTFYIGSNGYISLLSGDIRRSETLIDHFDLPRISGLFDDLDPSAGGSVSWKQMDDKVVVTFKNVPEYSLFNTNSFQIEMLFNGKIRITWLGIDAYDGLVGLSDGYGLPLYFSETNLSEYGVCDFIGDLNGDFDVDFTDFAILASYWCEPYEVTTTETVLDQFNDVSFSGNDGIENWNNDWQEIGESDGPSEGDVQVIGYFKSMRIGSYAQGKGLVREADLGSATFAVLTFDWLSVGPYYGNDTTVDISNDGGDTWTTLFTVPDGYSGGWRSESFDISGYVAPDTRVRFISNNRGSGYIYFDNVQIEYDVPYVNDCWCDECDLNNDFSIDTYDLCVMGEHWLE